MLACDLPARSRAPDCFSGDENRRSGGWNNENHKRIIEEKERRAKIVTRHLHQKTSAQTSQNDRERQQTDGKREQVRLSLKLNILRGEIAKQSRKPNRATLKVSDGAETRKPRRGFGDQESGNN